MNAHYILITFALFTKKSIEVFFCLLLFPKGKQMMNVHNIVLFSFSIIMVPTALVPPQRGPNEKLTTSMCNAPERTETDVYAVVQGSHSNTGSKICCLIQVYIH